MAFPRCQLECEIPQNPVELWEVLRALCIVYPFLIFRSDRFCDVRDQSDIFDCQFIDAAHRVVEEAGTEQQREGKYPRIVI